jgi:hypothetical protein
VKPGRLLLACVLFSSATGGGCFLGYDSRWGQAKQAQRQLAEAGPAATVADESPRPAPPTKRVWHVRFRPNQKYLAQTVDAPKQLEDLLADASNILEPMLGLRLEEERIVPWELDSDDDLRAVLGELRTAERADDVDLVVGLVGALPHQTESLHEAGMAALLGKHVVLRAASRGGELDAIDRTFDQLSAEERAAILKQRKRHRALAVFLHEVGHCLGALHETDPRSIMNRTYSPKQAQLDTSTISLMQLALDSGDRVSVARAQLELLRTSTANAWLATERDAQIVSLSAVIDAARTATTVRPAARPAAPPRDPLPDLSPDDKNHFFRALQLFQHGIVGPAYAEGKPLFAAYPRSIPVQELRCQIATVRWLPKDQLLRECAPIGELRASPDGGP